MPTRKRYNDGGIVASTILEQLGGIGRLKVMTGAYNFIDVGNGVSFKMKNPRANYVKIKLNSMDLYDLEVGRIRGTTYKIVSEHKNVYAEDLKPLIEKASGLYLSFADGGMAKGGEISNIEELRKIIRKEADGDVFYLDRKYTINIGNYNATPYSAQAEKEKDGKVKISFTLPERKMVIYSNAFSEYSVDKNSYEKYGGIYYIHEPLNEELAKEILNKIFKKYASGGYMADGGELGIKNKLSKSSFSLPYQIAIYVPSTKDKNVIVSQKELESRVDEVKKYLAKLFGGFNSVKVEGGYQSQDKGLIKEDAVRVVAFGNKENLEENIGQLINKVKYWCKEWGQESMGVEFENDMYYVDENTKFEDGGIMASGGKVDTQGNPYVNVYARMKAKDYFGVESKGDAVKWFKLNAKPMSRKEAENWYQTKKSIDKLGKSNVYIGNIEYGYNTASGERRRFVKEDGGMLADGGKIKNTTLYIYSFDDGELILEDKLIRAKNLEEAEKIGRELFYDEVKNYYEEEGVAEINTGVKEAPYFMQLMSDKELRMPVYYAEGHNMADGGEIFQIKDSKDRYYSMMSGKPSWNESPDLGYQYSLEDAEKLVKSLAKDFSDLQIVKYNKDWWKFGTGGYVDLSKQMPSIMQDSKSFKVPEIDLVKIDDRTFKGSQIIRGSEDAVDVFRQFWNKNSLPISENLNVMFLNQANKVIGIYQHSKGSVNGTIADPEMIALAAVKSLAKGVIIAHNHPSGNLKPSQSDIDIANKIKNGLKLFDIKLLDSLIITEDSYNSLDDLGVMAKGGVLGKKYNIVKGNDGGVTTWVVKDQDGNKLADYFDRSEAFQFVSSKEFWDETYRKVVLKAIEEDNFTYYIESSYNYAYASDVKYYGESFSVEIRTNGIIKVDSIEVDDYIFSKEDWKIIGEFIKELKDIENDEYARGGKVKNKWIQEALKNDNQGALRRTAKRKGLLRGDENLSKSDLDKLQKMGGKTAKRAHLAETLRNFK